MQLSLKFFANFREAVGQKRIDREFPDGATAGEVLAELESAFAGLDLLEDDDLRPQINVLRNGRGVVHMEGVDTVLEDGDELSIFPPVAGGAGDAEAAGDRTAIEESFRGISQRLAVRYLSNLGGDHVAGDADGEGDHVAAEGDAGDGVDRLEGDDWTATLSSEKADIAGGTLRITEVTVRFEGDPSTLPALVERFSQKAMRAGG
jgi:molybdopterin synthase sulfur carrier subunit